MIPRVFSSLQDFETISKIGQGSFSTVYKVVYLSYPMVRRIQDGVIYAMKKVQMNMLKEKERENALNEVRILASLNQRFVIAYKDAFFDEPSNTLCIIMEFAEGGDISQMIKQKAKTQVLLCLFIRLKGSFHEQEIWKALVHMTYGLKNLHDKSILHRDLKCANVFITLDGTYKLGDLNVSKIAKRGLVYTQTGTPYYASPEIWRDEPYDGKSDIWSLGCVIYEMCALRPPFTANDMAGLYSKIQKGVYPCISNRYSYGLQLNSSTRPSCDQILHNPHVLNNGADYLDHKVQTPKLQLLKTIHLPKNGRYSGLSDQLPLKQYENKENQRTTVDKARQMERKANKKYVNESKDNSSHVINQDASPIKEVVFMRKQQNDSSPQLIDRLRNNRVPAVGLSSKPPIVRRVNHSPAISNKVSIHNEPEDRKRIHRISSVQQETPRELPSLTPQSRKAHERRPISQYLGELCMEEQISRKERQLIQPLHKQLSDQTPFKRTPSKDLYHLNNQPYLQELPPLGSQRRYERKQSPCFAPRVVVPKSSPFHVERKVFRNRRINVSCLQNEHYLLD